MTETERDLTDRQIDIDRQTLTDINRDKKGLTDKRQRASILTETERDCQTDRPTDIDRDRN